jgi:hypothetical protein
VASAWLEDADGAPVSKSPAMTEFRPSNSVPLLGLAARCNSIRDKMLVGLVLFTLVRTGEALAGDHASIANATLDPDFGNLRQSPPPARASITSPEFFAMPTAADSRLFSTTDFRPRKPTLFDRDPTVNGFGDAPMLRGTTVWQRMSEYRSHDRVRLLTLWESSESTVSLQAGKRGDPSLQWTSRSMNRGGSTRGLLDRLFAVSLAGAGNRLRHSDRPTGAAAATPIQASVPVVAGAK